MEENSNQINEVPNTSKELNSDVRMWAMIAHLASLIVFIIPVFGNIIGPLLIWVLKRDEHPFISDQGKESINFQLSITIYIFISVILIFAAIGIVLLILVGLASVILTVIAAINAYDGKAYRYPLTIRFIK